MDVINKLVEGYQTFKKDFYPKNKALYEELYHKGQSPEAMLITCSDSRITTQLLFGAGPGDLFVVRNVANLVPSYHDGELHMSTTAALEFAVTVLEVKHIIVVGHSVCGGIKALMAGDSALQNDTSIANWVMTFQKAKEQVEEKHPEDDFEQKCHHCELEALNLSLSNLREYPWIKERNENGLLKLHAWYYDFFKGELSRLNTETMDLESLEA